MIILEVIASVGLMWILKHGSILNKPRSFLSKHSLLLKELFSCSLCLGFWCGLAVGFCGFYFNKSYYYIYFPFVCSALCWLADSLLDLIQVLANYLDKKN